MSTWSRNGELSVVFSREKESSFSFALSTCSTLLLKFFRDELTNLLNWISPDLFLSPVCRHLHSLRLLRRDQGWIHEMLRDAENERMHLLTFLKLAKPGIFMRTALLGAQGVFFNFFFILYLAAPKLAHRFVGYLEEEAVVTYTNVIKEMEEGRLPEWDNLDAPNIAIDYWKLNKDAKLLDVIKSIRADEATHRFM